MEINNQINIQQNASSSVMKNPNTLKKAKFGALDEIDKTNALSPKQKSRTEFLEKFDKIKSESVKEELESIFEKITAQSDKIGEKVYLKDILEYKKLVKEFLNVATSNSHQFNNENFLDRKGRYRNYSTVKTVDRELETLTKDFINGQIDHMGVLKKMDDIRGMLLLSSIIQLLPATYPVLNAICRLYPPSNASISIHSPAK